MIENFSGTANGASKKNHRGKNELLGGTGKWSFFLGAACRDVSRLMFRRLDTNKIELIKKSICDSNEDKRLVIARAHDAEFCTSAEECKIKMQKTQHVVQNTWSYGW